MSLESICNSRLFVRYFRVDFYLFYVGNSGLFSNSTYKNMPHWNCSVGRAKNSQSPSSLTFRIRHKQQTSLISSETLILGAENETLSICSPLCISSNCLCPVLYTQFEGHLSCFKVPFSSPTFAIQTSELQLLTTNVRIIFELTKSKRDGLYL